MKPLVASAVTTVVGIVLGVLAALGVNAAVSQNTVPAPETPPADEVLFGQVEYGARN